MKIIGGTFGTSGSAYFSKDGYLVVEGAKKSVFKPDNLASLETRQTVEKGRAVFSLLLGLLILTPVLAFGLGFVIPFLGFFLGLAIGIWLSIVFSRTTNKTNFVDLVFSGGDKVSFECTPRQVNKLVQFKG